MNNTDKILLELVKTLSEPTEREAQMKLRASSVLPSTEELSELMQLLKGVVFPDFFHRQQQLLSNRLYRTGVDLERIYFILSRQIARGYVFCSDEADSAHLEQMAKEKTLSFMQQLSEIKRLLLTDVEAVGRRDPAVGSYGEVVFSYPAVLVMLHHRVAHALYKLCVPVIPRIIAEQAHSLTGIDIHPAAEIGEYFAIDHGTGIVIGETTIIGNNVMLYQGVTLGAKNFTYDQDGRPLDLPRHPIIEDNVTVYSNASILGRITVGHDSVIGGNVWVTRDVPPHSRILQGKLQTDFDLTDGAGI